MHQSGQDVPAGCLFCNTLHPDHRPALINLRRSGYPLCPQSGQVAMCHQTPNLPPPPPTPIFTPSQQALLCPSPWAAGAGHTACVLGGGAKGWADFRHKSSVSFQPRSLKNTEGGLLMYGFIIFTINCMPCISLELNKVKWVSDLFLFWLFYWLD